MGLMIAAAIERVDWEGVATSAVVVVSALAVGVVVHTVAWWLARRVAMRTGSAVGASIVARSRGPALLLLPLLAVDVVLPGLELPAGVAEPVQHAISLAMIVVVATLIVRMMLVAEDVIAAQFDMTAADNLRARQVQTQARIIRRTASVVVWVLAGAVMLMTFPRIKELGASVLASAGIAGIVIGMAARPTLSNLIAGIQIAFTGSVRLDDVVIVEGEWGRIEEITSAYIVVRIWDKRRLIVPLAYFVEKPFQNWTRVSADLLGTVFLVVDFTVPVEAVREELARLVRGHPKWDGEVAIVQVTDSKAEGVELRVLLSAQNAGDAFDLRCEVRERLVAFLQRSHPGALRRTRMELVPGSREALESAAVQRGGGRGGEREVEAGTA